MSAETKEIYVIDTSIKPSMNSWSRPPDGFELLIEESPDFRMAIDDQGNVLLIQ
jgi:hypothetical protein